MPRYEPSHHEPHGARLTDEALRFCLEHCDLAYHHCALDLHHPSCPLRGRALRVLRDPTAPADGDS